MNWIPKEPIEIPIDGKLDLHMFSPKEVPSLLSEYLKECQKRGIYEVRIIHGKGTGILGKKVRSILKKNPIVLSFHIDTGSSGWGATIAILKEGENT